jgi:hypothetical protein
VSAGDAHWKAHEGSRRDIGVTASLYGFPYSVKQLASGAGVDLPSPFIFFQEDSAVSIGGHHRLLLCQNR